MACQENRRTSGGCVQLPHRAVRGGGVADSRAAWFPGWRRSGWVLRDPALDTMIDYE